jgi:hypothetical protein
MQKLKKLELQLDVIHRKGPDRFVRHWQKFMFFGKPVSPATWPSGRNAILYFYFLIDKSAAGPDVIRPDDLIYMGERAMLSNFKNGWEVGPIKKQDSRYKWMHHCQNRRLLAVAYELPETGNYTCQENDDKLVRNCMGKRRSVEWFAMLDLLKRYGARSEIFRYAHGFTLNVRWLRSRDVIEDAKRILKDLRSSYGL